MTGWDLFGKICIGGYYLSMSHCWTKVSPHSHQTSWSWVTSLQSVRNRSSSSLHRSRGQGATHRLFLPTAHLRHVLPCSILAWRLSNLRHRFWFWRIYRLLIFINKKIVSWLLPIPKLCRHPPRSPGFQILEDIYWG